MTEPTNPLLQGLKLPGRIFQLPSKGIFYRNGELAADVREGEIHVHPMSAIDEINMKNPDQLFNGSAVDVVFKQCAPSILKPTELLSKDVDAVMLFLRTVTYGSSYEFSANHRCRSQLKDAEGKLKLDEAGKPIIVVGKAHPQTANIDQLINEMKYVDPTLIADTFKVPLSNGQVVKLKPNKYRHVLNVLQEFQGKKDLTVADQQKNLVMMMLGVVESVDGITDEAQVTEWLKAVPSPLLNRVAEKVDEVNAWGSDLKWTCSCPECGENYTVEIPVNPASFFNEQ